MSTDQDQWRCPECGTLVEPSLVRRHHEQDCEALPDKPEDEVDPRSWEARIPF